VLGQTSKCWVAGVANSAGTVLTASSVWLVVRSELTTNPNGRSGVWLTEQHSGRASLSAGIRASSSGQHVIAPMACICCMLMEHCITWSPVTSASPASAQSAIASIRVEVTILRIMVLCRMLEALFFRLLACQSVTFVTLRHLF